MRFLMPSLALVAFVLNLHGDDRRYPADVTKWKEIPRPAETNAVELMVWTQSANYSGNEWHVRVDQSRVTASRTTSQAPKRRSGRHPRFSPKIDNLGNEYECMAVDDGWLIGFNSGEFGGALYWFNKNGKSKYKISNHQVVSFFKRTNEIYAIEGLSHLGVSCGSLIRIDRRNGNRWTASEVAKLPAAPAAVSIGSADSFLITLSDRLVLMTRDRKIRTLIDHAPWDLLYPKSSALTADARFLYIGMRQFVAEVDLVTDKLRFLVPSDQFLNKLSREDEAYVRKYYGSETHPETKR